MIISEQINAVFKTNKRGKQIGKPIGEKIVLNFNTPMNPGTIGNAGDYQVFWTTTRHVKKQTVTTPHFVPVQSVIVNASNDGVTLQTAATSKFYAKGGKLKLVSIVSAAGVPLAGTTVFTIGPRASSIG
jgi:hypothetical protein